MLDALNTGSSEHVLDAFPPLRDVSFPVRRTCASPHVLRASSTSSPSALQRMHRHAESFEALSVSACLTCALSALAFQEQIKLFHYRLGRNIGKVIFPLRSLSRSTSGTTTVAINWLGYLFLPLSFALQC